MLLLSGKHRIEGLQGLIKQHDVVDLLVALDGPDSRYGVMNGRTRLHLLRGIQLQMSRQVANSVVFPLLRDVCSLLDPLGEAEDKSQGDSAKRSNQKKKKKRDGQFPAESHSTCATSSAGS